MCGALVQYLTTENKHFQPMGANMGILCLLYTSDGCASVWAPKTLRASMGAAVRIPVIEAGAMPDAIAQLREKGITCLAAALYKSQPLSAAQASYPGGVCVVIGSEGQGLTDRTVEACDMAVRIPMTDRVESLNAAVAGSVLLWHFRGV